eukprot:4903554-Prymnesium_polylepis.1
MLDLCVHDRAWLHRVCCASRRVPRPRASPRRPVKHTHACRSCFSRADVADAKGGSMAEMRARWTAVGNVRGG